MNTRQRAIATCAGGCVVALLALLPWAVTRHGFGGADSLVYLGAAENVHDGKGVTTPFELLASQYSPSKAASFGDAIPLTHFPPAFPTTLAAISTVGPSVSDAARLLNAVLFGVNLVLLGIVAWTGLRSRVLAVAVPALMIVGPTAPNTFGVHDSWLRIHSGVQAEPLCFAFVLAGLLCLERCLRQATWRWTVAIGAFGAAAFLTRYVAVAFVVAAAIVVVLWSDGDWPRRLRRACTIGAVGIAPSILWSAVTSIVMHASAARSVHAHLQPLSPAYRTMAGWFVPGSAPGALRVLVAAGVVAALVSSLVVTRTSAHTQKVVAASSVFVVVHVAVVVLTRDFLDVETELDNRMLSIVQPLLYIVVLHAVVRLVRRAWDSRRAVALATALLVVVAAFAWRPSYNAVRRSLHIEPATLTVTEFVDSLPPGTFVASNLPDVLWNTTGHAVLRVPSHVHALSRTEDHDFDRNMRELVALVRKRHGYIALEGFAASIVTGEYRLASPDDFRRFPGLRVVQRYDDGSVVFASR